MRQCDQEGTTLDPRQKAEKRCDQEGRDQGDAAGQGLPTATKRSVSQSMDSPHSSRVNPVLLILWSSKTGENTALVVLNLSDCSHLLQQP